MKNKGFLRSYRFIRIMSVVFLFCLAASMCDFHANDKISSKALAVSKTNMKKAGEEYSKILQLYLEAYDNSVNEVYEKSDEVPYEFVEAISIDMGLSRDVKVVYRIVDYNKDETPEMFVGLRRKTYPKNSFEYTVYDAYTMKSGRAVRLMGHTTGNRGSTCVFCKKGLIANAWNGGAFSNGVVFCKMPKNKTKLMSYITLGYSGNAETGKGKYFMKKKKKHTRISKKKYNALMKKYYKSEKVTFYELTSKAVDNMKSGNFVYSGQKKWKLKG